MPFTSTSVIYSGRSMSALYTYFNIFPEKINSILLVLAYIIYMIICRIMEDYGDIVRKNRLFTLMESLYAAKELFLF